MIKYQPFPNCGTSFLMGTVWDHGEGGGFVPGTRIRVIGNGKQYIDIAGSHPDNPNQKKGNQGYWEVVFAPGPNAISGTVTIVDGNNQPLSPDYGFQLTGQCRRGDSVNEIVIDFSH